MIDLNTIRDVKVLEEMKKDLTLFITDPIILEIYKEDYDFGEEDYKDDKDQALYLLDLVEKKIKLLILLCYPFRSWLIKKFYFFLH